MRKRVWVYLYLYEKNLRAIQQIYLKKLYHSQKIKPNKFPRLLIKLVFDF